MKIEAYTSDTTKHSTMNIPGAGDVSQYNDMYLTFYVIPEEPPREIVGGGGGEQSNENELLNDMREHVQELREQQYEFEDLEMRADNEQDREIYQREIGMMEDRIRSLLSYMQLFDE